MSFDPRSMMPTRVSVTRRQADMMWPPHQEDKYHVIKQERERKVAKRLAQAAADVMTDPTATVAERAIAIRYRLQQAQRPLPSKVARKAFRANLRELKRVRRMALHKKANAELRGKDGQVDWRNADSLLAMIP